MKTSPNSNFTKHDLEKNRITYEIILNSQENGSVLVVLQINNEVNRNNFGNNLKCSDFKHII